MANDQATIETQRLELSLWRPEDAAVLLDIRSRSEVAKWLASPEPWTELTQAEDAIAKWADRDGQDPPFGNWAIRPSGGQPVGTVSLRHIPCGDGEVEIGWHLHPNAGGKGYAREAAAALLTAAFDAGIDQVWAIMWPHNEPSAALAASIGMTDLGVVEDPWYGTEKDPLSLMFRADKPLTHRGE